MSNPPHHTVYVVSAEQKRSQTTMTISDSHHPEAIAQELSRRLRPALQRWGRYASTEYPAFQPVVTLQLTSVEAHARALVEAEQPRRAVTDTDRQQAVWYLVRAAIATLRPPLDTLPSDVQDAMRHMPQQRWPNGLIAPQECHRYLVLSLAYVTKSHANKELAAIFQVSARTLATIRNQAIAAVAQRIVQWDVEQYQQAGRHLQLAADRRSTPQINAASKGLNFP
jgi:hypothetical protein